MVKLGTKVKNRYIKEPGIVVGHGLLQWPKPSWSDEENRPVVSVYLVQVAEGSNSLTGPACAVWAVDNTEEVG